MKRSMIALAVLAFLAVPTYGQTVKPSPTPQITDAQRADFFKAQSQLTTVRAQLTEVQANFQAAVGKLQQVCGETATLQMNQAGDPVCVVKAAPKK